MERMGFKSFYYLTNVHFGIIKLKWVYNNLYFQLKCFLNVEKPMDIGNLKQFYYNKFRVVIPQHHINNSDNSVCYSNIILINGHQV